MSKTRKKHLPIPALLLAAALLFGTAFFGSVDKAYASDIATVTIGEGAGSSSIVPYCNDWANARTQFIYNAEDIGVDGSILSVSFNVAEADPAFSVRNLKIWMGYTKDEFYDWDSVAYINRSELTLDESEVTLVYNGAPDLGAKTGWETIDLDTPFAYKREYGNLVIVTGLKAKSGSGTLKYSCTVLGSGSNPSIAHDKIAAIYSGDNSDEDVADISKQPALPWKIRSERADISLDIDTSEIPAEYFRVAFDADGGEPVPVSQRVAAGEKASRPEDPAKEGCDFGGWYNGDSEYDFDAPVNAPLSLKVKWIKKTYTIRFVDEDGETELQTVSAEHGDKPEFTGETPVKPSAEGVDYMFAGWDPPIRAADGDQTYKAVFIDASHLADKTELNKTIKAAEDARTGIKTSEDGSDVGPNFKYVTAAERQAYEDAFIAAQETADDPLASQEAVDEADSGLKAAMEAFAAAQRSGSKVLPVIEKVVISKASGRQQPAAGGVYEWQITFSEGSDLSKITDDDFQIQRKPSGASWKNSKCPAAIFDRENGILMGQGIPDNTKEGDNTNLWRFVYAGDSLVGEADFPVITQDGYQKVDKESLDEAVKNAQAAQEGVSVSEDGMDVDPEDKYVTSAEKKALDDAIASAQAVAADGRATQKHVDEAVQALNAAVEAFNSAKKSGKMYDPTGGYAPGDYRLIYETAKVTLPDIPVREIAAEGSEPVWFNEGPVKFEFYDSTLQKSLGVYTTAEGTYTDEGGAEHKAQILSGVELIRGHRYIVSVHEKDYMIVNSYEVTIDDDGSGNSDVYSSNMVNYYISLSADGAAPSDIKKGGSLQFFDVMKRAKALRDVTDAKRVNIRIPVFYTQDGTAKTILSLASGAVIRLSSPDETLYITSDDYGYISASLIEDECYIVQIVEDSNAIGLASFPLTVKDHAENGWPKSIYNHFSCGSVQGIYLVDKGLEHAKDTTLVSLSKKTSVTGMNFMNDMPTDTDHYFVNDALLDKGIVNGLSGKDYEVFTVEAINMYRTEISKLAAGSFTITREVPSDKQVDKVYYINRSGKLKKLDFTEKDGKVEFVMNTLSMYPNVIVFKDRMGSDGTALGKGAPLSAAEKAIARVGVSNDKDPAGTVFRVLRLRSSKQTKKSVSLKWAAASGATKYILYGNLSGKGHGMQKIAEVSGTSYTAKKAAGKALKAGKYYKFMLVAVDSNRNVVSASKIVHVATKGGKAGNYKAVKTKAKKNKVSVKKGKSFRLGAKQLAAGKKLKVKKYAKLRYETSNASVATVSSKGVIKGKKKGTCYIYAYTQSGTYKRIKVSVK